MQLRLTDALAFGALISAVDPVATLAIFSAMDVEPVLNMLGTDIKCYNFSCKAALRIQLGNFSDRPRQIHL